MTIDPTYESQKQLHAVVAGGEAEAFVEAARVVAANVSRELNQVTAAGAGAGEGEAGC